MTEPKPEAAAASGQITAPKITAEKEKTPEFPAFTASRAERLAALLMFPLAYCYVWMYGFSWGRLKLVVFTLGFLALTEYLHRKTPRAKESWVWLACVLLVAASIVLERGRIWGYFSTPYWFLHIFAVWWALSRTGTLLEGGSGSLLPLDALDGFFVFPFQHYLLRIRTLALMARNRRGGKKLSKNAVWSLAALAAAAVLFVTAAGLLMRADSMFHNLLAGFVDLFRIDWPNVDLVPFLFRFILSLPVGAYLFGLLAGTGREDRAALRERGAGVRRALGTLRRAPNRVWTLLTALFCLLYLAFFVVQARYLFGAFSGRPPEGFLVSEYARQGFFELCRVIAVNFTLLWLVTRTSAEEVHAHRSAAAVCLALLAESLLLAVVAFSKLALYISWFGFTPKRLQSTWLVCVLAFGCICAGWSLARGKKTFRIWMMFGALTLSLLCLY